MSGLGNDDESRGKYGRIEIDYVSYKIDCSVSDETRWRKRYRSVL